MAQAILERYCVHRYVLLDFSPAMHDLARAHLALHRAKVQFLTRDFRQWNWTKGLGPFDAVVTMQAAHETRHKRHLPQFLTAARRCLRPGGLLLYCDHYAAPGKLPISLPRLPPSARRSQMQDFTTSPCYVAPTGWRSMPPAHRSVGV